MLGITVLAIVLAFRYESASLAILGVAGAYLSPILIRSNQDQQIHLFMYLTVLNLATLVLLTKRYWTKLLYLSFLGTVLDFALWGGSYSTEENTITSFVFTLVTFTIFILGAGGIFRLQALKENLKQKAESYFAILCTFVAIFYCSAITILLYTHHYSFLALAGMTGAVITLIAYTLVDRLQFKQINYTLVFVATIFLVLSAIWQYDHKVLDLALIILGLLGIGVGIGMKLPEFRVMGLVILLATAVLVLAENYDFENYNFIFNSKFGVIIFEILALWFAGWLYGKNQIEKFEENNNNLLSVTGVIVLWLGFSWELSQYFNASDSLNAKNLLLSLWWIGYATAVIIFGSVVKSAILRKLAIGLFAISIVKVFLFDVQALDTGFRIVSFIVLGVILLSVSFAYQRNKEKITKFLEGEKAVDSL
jgi:uncharacterized membrane protein